MGLRRLRIGEVDEQDQDEVNEISKHKAKPENILDCEIREMHQIV
jgi:hypothetical protein